MNYAADYDDETLETEDQPEFENEHASTSEDEAADLLSKFWAAERDPKKLYSTVMSKEENYLQAAERRGLFDICRLMYGMYFGVGSGGGSGTTQWATQSIQFSGENGELVEFSANELRSFVDQVVNMMTKDRPAFQCEAQNTDYASLAQVESDDAMVTYFYEQEMGERREKELAKWEALYAKAFQHTDWDPDGGPKVKIPEDVPHPDGALQTEKEVPSGEFDVRALKWWEVISEVGRSEYDKHHWRTAVLHNKSKAEAMVRWPAFAKAISQVTSDDSEWRFKFPGADIEAPVNDDACTFRIFYHAKTAALPHGRRCIFVGDVWVNPDDDKLPTDEIPLKPLMSCELHGTSFGISDLWNLIPLEQMQNQVLSDMATNIEAFGRPPIMLPEGADIDLDALANGQRVIFVPPDMQQPAAMKFPDLPPMSFKMLDLLRSYKQSISQLNAISRGDTAQGVTSGAHAALYEQIAVEAQSPRQLELNLLREATGNIMLQYLKAFAKHPQLVAVVGIDERPYLRTFYPENFAGVARVRVKAANPMMSTISGRMQVVDMLRQFPGNPLSDPQQIIELVTTGKMKPMFNLTRTIDLHVRWENEQLLKGPAVTQMPPQTDPMSGMQVQAGYARVPTVPVVAFESISKHLVAHLEVVYSPEARENPAVMTAALAHLEEHFFYAKNADPFVSQILGNPMPQQLGQPPAAGEQVPGGQPAGGEPTPKQSGDAVKAMADPNAADDSKSSMPQAAKPAQPAGRPAGQQTQL
jgi:hypothetical protein